MTGAAGAGSIQTAGHGIQTTDAEAHLSVGAGTTVTETITCADGYFATSGGFLTDAVDDGDVSSVFVTSSRLQGTSSWTVTVRNDNDVRAQGKLKVSCLSLTTAAVQDKHSHGFTFSDATVVGLSSVGTRTLECKADQIPFALGYDAGTSAVVASKVQADSKLRRATFEVSFLEDPSFVSFTARCLDVKLSAPLAKDAPAVVAPDVGLAFEAGEGITEANVACPTGTVSLTPSFSFPADSGLAYLGNDPRGTQRMFRFANPFDEATTADLAVTCLGAAPVAADPVQKITIEPVAKKDKHNHVAVTVGCVFKCTVTVKLYGRWAGSQVIAVGKAVIAGGKTKPVVLKAKSAFWKDWLKTGTTGTVKAVAGSVRATQHITFG
ncbi:hypothetical protein [Nocardioides marmotae]|uniref:hypothetical protein n=1 Tax=Nocardioides marmotae TaxID=2663857 RepID=UPI0012B5B529|nr:hypothetical protein [Nocardioides marmotae]MBC9731628.1 hypothetical protein [Nocardioides marmotae]MTB82750.1 hypothetical protein [Nocardioides marmotae]